MSLYSNSLDCFDFAMRHQFRKCRHVQIIETACFNFALAMGVLNNDEHVLLMTHDMTQLHHGLVKVH